MGKIINLNKQIKICNYLRNFLIFNIAELFNNNNTLKDGGLDE